MAIEISSQLESFHFIEFVEYFIGIYKYQIILTFLATWSREIFTYYNLFSTHIYFKKNIWLTGHVVELELFIYGAGGNIFLPWTLRDAKISRVIRVPYSRRGRRREGAIPLWWRVQPITEWLVAPRCSRTRAWPLLQTYALARWTTGNLLLLLPNLPILGY